MQRVPLKDIIKAQAFSKFFNADLNAESIFRIYYILRIII